MNRRAMILAGTSYAAAAAALLAGSAALADGVGVTGGDPAPARSADAGPDAAAPGGGGASGGASHVTPERSGAAGVKSPKPTAFTCPHCGLVIPVVLQEGGTCTAHACHG